MPYALSFPENNSAIQCIYWIKSRGGTLLFLWKNTVLKIFRCPLNLLYGTIALNLVFICKIFTLYKLAEFLINYIIYTYTKQFIYNPIISCRSKLTTYTIIYNDRSLKHQNISFEISTLDSLLYRVWNCSIYFLDRLNTIKLLRICKILIKYQVARFVLS